MRFLDDRVDSDSSQETSDSLTEISTSNGHIELGTTQDCDTPGPLFNKITISISSTSDDEILIRKKAKTNVLDASSIVPEFHDTIRILTRKKIKTRILDAPVFRPTVDEFNVSIKSILYIIDIIMTYDLNVTSVRFSAVPSQFYF